jgi:hypothetical protein
MRRLQSRGAEKSALAGFAAHTHVGGTGRNVTLKEHRKALAQVKIGNYALKLPENRLARIGIGVSLVFLGLLGFLPILGFWMIPAGVLVLATAVPAVRRFNRRVLIAVRGWWIGRKPRQRSPAA